MDLNEQADRALDDQLATHGGGVTFSAEQRRIARLMWFDGYQRGIDATTARARANEAFESWKVTP